MGFRLLANGDLLVDTAEELVAYQRLIQEDHLALPRGLDGWTTFCDFVSQPRCMMQRKVLALIWGRGTDGMSVDELVEALDVDGASVVTGTIGSIIKTAKRAGLSSPEILVPLPGQVYRAGRLLLEHTPPTP